MAPHSSTFAWKIPWTEEPDRLQSMGLLESDTTEWLHFHFSLSCIGEGNGNPLQCSCLENPRDGGAWWAAIYGVAQSRTWLTRLSSSSSSSYEIFACFYILKIAFDLFFLKFMGLHFSLMIHFELIFVESVRFGLKFIIIIIFWLWVFSCSSAIC